MAQMGDMLGDMDEQLEDLTDDSGDRAASSPRGSQAEA